MSAATPIPQRLLFVCGSLPPGRDGVGDYTRRLARHLQGRDCQVTLVATHDKEITVPTPEEQEGIEVMRIPIDTSAAVRRRLLQQAVDRLAPRWISVQYVPYSFSARGLPFNFVRTLGRIDTGGAAWHLMFHELWQRRPPLLSPKKRLLHWLQRAAARRLVRTLKPLRIHTHLPAYRHDLRRAGIDADPLPLFANIGRQPGATAAGSERRPHIYRLCFFSRMESPPVVLDALRDVATWTRTRDLSLEVALLGGGKEKVASARAALQAALPDATVLPVGFLEPAELSAWLSSSDLAVSPIPRHALGKSGTVAAFLEHALPVLAPVATEAAPPFFAEALNAVILPRFDAERITVVRRALAEGTMPTNDLPAVGDRFCGDLDLLSPAPHLPEL